MRALFAKLERAAPTTRRCCCSASRAPARRCWPGDPRASPRKDGPFVVARLLRRARHLIESELFGQVHGAFTGANGDAPGCSSAPTAGRSSSTSSASSRSSCSRSSAGPRGAAAAWPGAPQWAAVRRADGGGDAPRSARRGRSGRFREDLYYRLAVVEVQVLAAARAQGRYPAAGRALPRLAGAARALSRMPPNALALLRAHDWPGWRRFILQRPLRSRARLAGSKPGWSIRSRKAADPA